MELSGLTIRSHERQTIDLEVEFVVADAHREQVRFSPGSPAAGAFVVRGQAEDISPGGMGLILPQFLPKMCEGTVRVYGSTPIDVAADGTPVFEAIFEHAVKVRRLALASHEPTYAIGISFVDPEPDLDRRVRAVMTLARLAEPAPEPPGDDADA